MSRPSSRYLKLILSIISLVGILLYVGSDAAPHRANMELPYSLLELRRVNTESDLNIEEEKSYADFLLPNGSKRYSVQAQKDGLLILFFKIDTENARLQIIAEGALNRSLLNIVHDPNLFIYYVRDYGEVQITITNIQIDAIQYRFMVSASKPLRDAGSRTLALEGGQIAYHVDLKKGDQVNLDLNYLESLNLKTRVFVPCYVIESTKVSYFLRLFEEGVGKTLSFSADLGGRYYIIVESVKGLGTFSIVRTVSSPPWNQEWFWYMHNIAILSAILWFVWSRKEITGKSSRSTKVALISYSSWFVTIGLFVSAVSYFTYEISIHTPLFCILISSLGSSLGIQVYATHLDRKRTTITCRYCGREVDITKDNYCCGHIVKNVSSSWFLIPLLFSFFLYTVASFVAQILPTPEDAPLWLAGSGGFVGGSIAWWTNRHIHATRPWKFLVEGVLVSFLSPLLTVILAQLILHPNIDAEWVGKMIRIRIAPPSLPSGVAVLSTLLAVTLGLSLAYHLRKTVFSEKT